ncbi:hypothetical protein C1Y63_11780 [Corynebacterium sp. 13CS0277]|uniref:hypothetical protein n=1 Tax=Corynebacterium sp. 13CS0277 TaxID=2071994 RepID=UPI000D02C14A|nr:hypothetical protein [Corynebacterium sp. 13CS0277]PRQ10371.1 hypothetical protein C1Y63_11780 [Corynebacterium sp. 13CS0277]
MSTDTCTPPPARGRRARLLAAALWVLLTIITLVEMILLIGGVAATAAGTQAAAHHWWKIAALPRVWLLVEQRDQFAAITYSLLHGLPGFPARYSQAAPLLFGLVLAVRMLCLLLVGWARNDRVLRAATGVLVALCGITACADVVSVIAQSAAHPTGWLLLDAAIMAAAAVSITRQAR